MRELVKKLNKQAITTKAAPFEPGDSGIEVRH
jgi:hypothetical protein